MRHDWVFEVLTDLSDYAEMNGFPRLARKVAETLAVAREEIVATQDEGGGAGGGGETSLH